MTDKKFLKENSLLVLVSKMASDYFKLPKIIIYESIYTHTYIN